MKHLTFLLLFLVPFLLTAQTFTPSETTLQPKDDRLMIMVTDSVDGLPTGQYYWTGVPFESAIKRALPKLDIDSTDNQADIADLTFDGNRNILRTPSAGDNLEASNLQEWMNWWYIQPFVAPTISIVQSPATALREVGTSTVHTISGSVSNPRAAALSAGNVSFHNHAFAGNTSYSFSYTFAPTAVTTASYKASQTYQGSGDYISYSGTANSATKTIRSAYPVFFGLSQTEYTGGAIPYNAFTKSVRVEGNFNPTLSGSGFIYILIPKSWADFNLSKIIDHNGFNVTGSFTAYDGTITSTGLPNNWTQDYKIYKLNNLTVASGNVFQIQR